MEYTVKIEGDLEKDSVCLYVFIKLIKVSSDYYFIHVLYVKYVNISNGMLPLIIRLFLVLKSWLLLYNS